MSVFEETCSGKEFTLPEYLPNSEYLKDAGKEVIFEMTEGGHFSAIAPRLESAITTLLTP